jgi:hypothetical protein
MRSYLPLERHENAKHQFFKGKILRSRGDHVDRIANIDSLAGSDVSALGSISDVLDRIRDWQN